MELKGLSFSRYVFLLCVFFFKSVSATQAESPKLVVVIPSYNNKQWYEKNLKSVFSQKYDNFTILYIDDCSTDGTGDLVEAYKNAHKEGKRMVLYKNQKRKGGLANIYHAVHLCDDEAIVVLLDGDDWFANDRVLQIVSDAYIKNTIWMTHGTFKRYPSGRKEALSKPYPKRIINTNQFRKMPCPLPLRTFYAWLFKKIKKEDLMKDGEFFMMSQDAAIMYPLIEMAGNRHQFIYQTLYIYNAINPISDRRVNAQLQKEISDYIQQLPPYPRLKNRDDSP